MIIYNRIVIGQKCNLQLSRKCDDILNKNSNLASNNPVLLII